MLLLALIRQIDKDSPLLDLDNTAPSSKNRKFDTFDSSARRIFQIRRAERM